MSPTLSTRASARSCPPALSITLLAAKPHTLTSYRPPLPPSRRGQPRGYAVAEPPRARKGREKRKKRRKRRREEGRRGQSQR
eukprot:834618-Rhodomonas_salina.1